MPHWLQRVIAAGAFLALSLPHARAAESQSVTFAHTTAALLSDTDTIAPGTSLHLALDLQLAPGWHTYWHNPGDAGIPVSLSLTLPPKFEAGPILWPTPSRLVEGDLITYGYTGHVVLPVAVLAGRGAMHVQASASWLVCRDVCIPQQANFTLDLPQGQPAPSAQAADIRSALQSVPGPSPFSTAIRPDGSLILSGFGLPAAGTIASFIPSADGAVEHAASQALQTAPGTLTLKLSPPRDQGPAAVLDGVLTITPPGRASVAYDVAATAAPTTMPPGGVVDGSLLALIAAALAGGCLLNLMPCVFPVLALKAMALSRLAQTDAKRIRQEALSYTAGVVLAFVSLGTALLIMRQAGSAVGWGFQLQSPRFVTVLAWLLFGTGLNMSGVFTIGSRLMGSGQALAGRSGHVGSFFTGLFAVVVAAPCTAAFMGAAVAGALVAPTPVALCIFGVMGIGMALPYLAFAALPRLARVLPRPGAWMAMLRQALAFPLYASVVWLAWVVSQQSGPSGVLVLGFGLVATGLAAWALGQTEASVLRIRLAGRALASVAAVVALLALAQSGAAASEQSEPFSVRRLAELRKAGRPVFVNLTAAWCLSCLVNERLSLSPRLVRNAFAQAHVAYLKGDWTRGDPAITAFLQEHGRDGVPLYLFYPPGQPATVLPQLLSEGTLLSQVARIRD